MSWFRKENTSFEASSFFCIPNISDNSKLAAGFEVVVVHGQCFTHW